jgi:hypothetical protein
MAVGANGLLLGDGTFLATKNPKKINAISHPSTGHHRFLSESQKRRSWIAMTNDGSPITNNGFQ